MKRILLSLMMVAATLLSATAAEVTFNFQDPVSLGYAAPALSGGETAVDEAKGITSGIIQLDFAKNGASNPARFWGGSTFIDLRAYSKATMTITATNGDNITSFDVEGSKIAAASMSFSTGTYAVNGKVGTWTGSANSIVITFSATIGFNNLKVTTVTASGVASPTFSPNGGKFYEPQDVELTCPTADATIYYTTDGTTPTSASTAYTTPIAVSKIGDTVIKAIAIKAGASSEVATATYTIAEPKTVENIAAFLATNTTGKPTGEMVTITSPVTVLYHGVSKTNSYLFLKDETAALQVYSAGTAFPHTYAMGDVIGGGISGSVGFYSNVPQMVPVLETFGTPTSGTVDAVVTTVEDISQEMINQLVFVYNTTIDLTAKTITDATLLIDYYSRFDGVTIPEDGRAYNVTAIVNAYNGKLQLFPIKFDVYSGVNDAVAGETTIVANTGNVNITVADNASAVIYNAAGQVVAQQAVVAGENTIDLTNGFYIVKVGNTVAKVIVK